MKVTVKLFGEFRVAVGADRLEVELPEGATCGEALRVLVEREPALGPLVFLGDAVRDHLQVFVNGRNVAHREGLATPLAPGDALTFFPLLSGG